MRLEELLSVQANVAAAAAERLRSRNPEYAPDASDALSNLRARGTQGIHVHVSDRMARMRLIEDEGDLSDPLIRVRYANLLMDCINDMALLWAMRLDAERQPAVAEAVLAAMDGDGPENCPRCLTVHPGTPYCVVPAEASSPE